MRVAGAQAASLPEDQPLPPVVEEAGQGTIHRARIAVRGLDRDPRVARKVLDRLRSLLGVRVQGSTGLLGAALSLRPLRNLLGLGAPSGLSWALIGGGAAAAVALSRLLGVQDGSRP
jgi:hypothetical protein